MSDRNGKTEKPTPKKIKEARKEGKVAKSHELFSWLSLLVATFVIPIVLSSASSKIEALFYAIPNSLSKPTADSAMNSLTSGFTTMVAIVSPIMIGAALLAIATSLAQTGFGLFLKSVKPTFSKISPMHGFKRLFSPTGVTEMVKSTLKIIVVAGLGYTQIRGLTSVLSTNSSIGIGQIVSETAKIILGATRIIAGFGMLLAIADFARQRKQLMDSLKMTKQEIKDEAREDMGDPLIKSRIRRLQLQLARQRMMASIENATVVVVNPTHFAVALSYNPERSPAPRVLAKGKDNLALVIKDRAAEFKIPIVRDPALARVLFVSTNVDDQIPPALYKAVAKLLAFVFRLSAFAKAQEVSHSTLASEVPKDLLEKAEAIA